MVLRGFFLLVFVIAASGSVHAQAKDSLLHHQLGEIVVGAGGNEVPRSTGATMQRVSLAGIVQSDAASIDGVLRSIPAAHVQTNSRGEALVYLRNSGERQVAVFFDGALLNVPWDNRIDLSLVPSDVVGEITVAKGVPSVLYGTNVLGGALNMTSRTLNSPGYFTRVSGAAGSVGALSGRVAHLGRTRHLGYVLSAGYTQRDGVTVPAGADLPFSQEGHDVRTNTDRRLLNLFGQATYLSDSGLRVGLTVLRVSGAKGIAPESHMDPHVSRIRYWRYPSRTTMMVILTGEAPIGSRGAMLRGAAWNSHFSQTIEQYASVAYQNLLEDQEDEDGTQGARITLLHPLGPGELRLAVNAYTSGHTQVGRTVGISTGVASMTAPLSYRQHVWSSGFEYTWRMSRRLGLLFGASMDGHGTPGTGDKPPRPAQVDYGLTSGLTYRLGDRWSLRAALGRKVRFPTMRELFGEALGRFLVNPELRAESSLLAEMAIGMESPRMQGEAIVFLNRTFDTIDQRNVVIDGEELPRRMRVNLEGSRVGGLEIVSGARFGRGWRLSANLTWMQAQAYMQEGHVPLAEKPEILGAFALRYNDPSGASALVQTVVTGRTHGLADNNTLVALPSSTVINIRIAYLFIHSRFATEIFARVNNATDDVTLPQLGLPGPGRDIQAGLEVSF